MATTPIVTVRRYRVSYRVEGYAVELVVMATSRADALWQFMAAAETPDLIHTEAVLIEEVGAST